MNNFILSGKGFLKSITFDDESKKLLFKWTQHIREAVKFKTSTTARNFIKKHKFEAFVWNPYEEEPIRGKWEISKRSEYNRFSNVNHKVLEWRPVRVVMEKKTDVNFLVTKGINNKTYYDSFEDAVDACIVKNNEILNEIQEKITIMKNDKENYY